MKHSLAFPLFALVGLLAASRPTLAAATKSDARTTALVAALQAVSPDPLGGRLGLAASAARTPAVATVAGGSSYTAQSQQAESDRRAYIIWKSSQKS